MYRLLIHNSSKIYLHSHTPCKKEAGRMKRFTKFLGFGKYNVYRGREHAVKPRGS